MKHSSAYQWLAGSKQCGRTGIDSWSFRLMPMDIVVMEEGQDPQAPLSRK